MYDKTRIISAWDYIRVKIDEEKKKRRISSEQALIHNVGNDISLFIFVLYRNG